MRWKHLGLGLIAGLGLALAQEPYNFKITLIAVAVLMGFVTGLPNFKKYWFGYGFGLGYFLLLMVWIEAPFAIRGPEFTPLAIPAYLLMATGLALFYTPFFAFFEARFSYLSRLLGTIAIVTFMEWLRGTIFTGLPWGLPAYIVLDTALAPSLAYIGPYLLSGFVIASFSLFAFSFYRDKQFIIGMFILILPLVAAFRPAPTLLDVADYEIAVVQANFPQSDRHSIDMQTPMLDAQIALSQDHLNADLIVWPETSVAYSPEDTVGMLDYLQNNLGGTRLFMGAPKYLTFGQYNSGYLIENGEILYRYDKQHLVPYGEYIPFSELLISLGFPEAALTGFSIRKGEAQEVPPMIAAASFKPLICYEGIFPDEARGDEAFIIQITNDSWFGPSAGPRQHFASLRARAIEAGKPVARAATTGISAIIDAQGEVLAEVPLNERGSAVAKLGPRYETTLYNRFGDIITWFGVLLGFSAAALLTPRKKKAIEPAT